MAKNDDSDHKSDDPLENPSRVLLEPSSARRSGRSLVPDRRIAVHDGLDNSDLRMLLDIATKEAKKDE